MKKEEIESLVENSKNSELIEQNKLSSCRFGSESENGSFYNHKIISESSNSDNENQF